MTKLKWSFPCIALFLASLVTLTGCPGAGDRLRADEKATATKVGDSICFAIPDAEDYQPVNIAINPKGTDFRDRHIIFDPKLRVTKEQLCISPSFYHFPDKGQFIVSYVLISKRHQDKPRRMVAGLEISSGRVFNIPLTDMEILRPYNEMNIP